MSNNDIMKKLRVALKLNDQEIVEILKLVDFSITKKSGMIAQYSDMRTGISYWNCQLGKFAKKSELTL